MTSHNPIDLDTSLVQLSEKDDWTVGDSHEGAIVPGSSGGGKTTGSAHTFANAFMGADFGGLTLTTKIDEKDQWREWAAESGRQDDLIIVKPTNPVYYDFMERAAKEQDGSDTQTMTSLFKLIMEIANGGSIESKDAFWGLSRDQMTRNTIDMLKCAGEVVSINNMYRFVVTAPNSPSQLVSSNWQNESYAFQCLNKATDLIDELKDSGNRAIHYEDFEMPYKYWTYEFPNLAEKTRSIIVSMFTSTADMFLRGNIKKLFNTDVYKQEIYPEMAREGKIILLDLPIKSYDQVGVVAQGVYKLCFQKAMERVKVNKDTRSVFLFADECQYTLTSYEESFQQTARSSRIATFYLTQSISNLHLNLGERGEQRTNSLLTNLGTKIFHAQADTQTNEWASKIIGEDWSLQSSSSSSYDDQNDPRMSANISEQRRYIFEPIEFTRLQRGGKKFDHVVSAIVHQVGRTWSTGENYLEVFFKQ